MMTGKTVDLFRLWLLTCHVKGYSLLLFLMKSDFKSIGTILSFLKPGNTDKNEEYITKPHQQNKEAAWIYSYEK